MMKKLSPTLSVLAPLSLMATRPLETRVQTLDLEYPEDRGILIREIPMFKIDLKVLGTKGKRNQGPDNRLYIGLNIREM